MYLHMYIHKEAGFKWRKNHKALQKLYKLDRVKEHKKILRTRIDLAFNVSDVQLVA
jgi:hypothetical protein